ncbi:hypothetical protein PCE1_002084 [Barthelona sp. PCE]
MDFFDRISEVIGVPFDECEAKIGPSPFCGKSISSFFVPDYDEDICFCESCKDLQPEGTKFVLQCGEELQAFCDFRREISEEEYISEVCETLSCPPTFLKDIQKIFEEIYASKDIVSIFHRILSADWFRPIVMLVLRNTVLCDVESLTAFVENFKIQGYPVTALSDFLLLIGPFHLVWNPQFMVFGQLKAVIMSVFGDIEEVYDLVAACEFQLHPIADELIGRCPEIPFVMLHSVMLDMGLVFPYDRSVVYDVILGVTQKGSENVLLPFTQGSSQLPYLEYLTLVDKLCSVFFFFDAIALDYAMLCDIDLFRVFGYCFYSLSIASIYPLPTSTPPALFWGDSDYFENLVMRLKSIRLYRPLSVDLTQFDDGILREFLVETIKFIAHMPDLTKLNILGLDKLFFLSIGGFKFAITYFFNISSFKGLGWISKIFKENVSVTQALATTDFYVFLILSILMQEMNNEWFFLEKPSVSIVHIYSQISFFANFLRFLCTLELVTFDYIVKSLRRQCNGNSLLFILCITAIIRMEMPLFNKYFFRSLIVGVLCSQDESERSILKSITDDAMEWDCNVADLFSLRRFKGVDIFNPTEKLYSVAEITFLMGLSGIERLTMNSPQGLSFLAFKPHVISFINEDIVNTGLDACASVYEDKNLELKVATLFLGEFLHSYYPDLVSPVNKDLKLVFDITDDEYALYPSVFSSIEEHWKHMRITRSEVQNRNTGISKAQQAIISKMDMAASALLSQFPLPGQDQSELDVPDYIKDCFIEYEHICPVCHEKIVLNASTLKDNQICVPFSSGLYFTKKLRKKHIPQLLETCFHIVHRKCMIHESMNFNCAKCNLQHWLCLPLPPSFDDRDECLQWYRKPMSCCVELTVPMLSHQVEMILQCIHNFNVSMGDHINMIAMLSFAHCFLPQLHARVHLMKAKKISEVMLNNAKKQLNFFEAIFSKHVENIMRFFPEVHVEYLSTTKDYVVLATYQLKDAALAELQKACIHRLIRKKCLRIDFTSIASIYNTEIKTWIHPSEEDVGRFLNCSDLKDVTLEDVEPGVYIHNDTGLVLVRDITKTVVFDTPFRGEMGESVIENQCPLTVDKKIANFINMYLKGMHSFLDITSHEYVIDVFPSGINMMYSVAEKVVELYPEQCEAYLPIMEHMLELQEEYMEGEDLF